MLILTRNKGQTIVIGDGEVKFKILGISGSQVRIGFDAPPEIPIHREEVFDRIKKEQEKNGD